LNIAKLKAAVGEGNFTVISPADDLLDDEEDDWLDDDEEEEDEDGFTDAEEVAGDTPAGIIPGRALPAGADPKKLQLINYDISFEPMHDERYIRYYKQLGDRLEKLHEQAAKEPKKAVPQLEELVLQYPQFPVLQNYLAVAYMNSGREQEAEQLIEQSYQNFPDYLFARLNYARLYLENGDLDRVAEILDNKFEIKLLYPERDTFHFSEVINFYNVAGRYFFEKGETDRAQTYADMMKKIDPEHPMTRQLEATLTLQKLKKGFKKLFGRSK
jgi:tetratricopeptide (TPR) repeat protein